MQTVPGQLFRDGLRQLIRLDGAWVPPAGQGGAVRSPLPLLDRYVNSRETGGSYMFVIFTFPFGTYYAAPVDVVVSERYVRAFPGGTGDVKPAGNYAGALLADEEAREAGFQTVLWLDGRERRFVEECGVMNVFFVIGEEVITPSLEGTILPGVTRDSVVTLLRDIGLRVTERRLPINEIVAAHDHGTLRECFGTGTAATVSHDHRSGPRPVLGRLLGIFPGPRWAPPGDRLESRVGHTVKPPLDMHRRAECFSRGQ